MFLHRVGKAVALLLAVVLAPLSTLFGMELLPAGSTQTSNISEAMKIIFSDPIVQNMVVESELLNRFRADTNVRTDDTTGGRYIEISILPFSFKEYLTARSIDTSNKYLNYEALFFDYVNETSLPKGVELREEGFMLVEFFLPLLGPGRR